MGCDIHAHVEVKIGDKWEHFNAPHVSRDYRLFAKMGNVRNSDEFSIEPLSDCRGIPDDVNAITRMIADVEDGHSASWLGRAEIEALSEWYRLRPDIDGTQGRFHGLEGVFGYISGNPLYCLGGGGEDRLFDDVRIVFWFDC